ncbi:MAG: 4-(cytidine 5'-diphospho)-2-C-methyl-D-erythritol kinase [Burkholderiales bacterium]|nr:4-(cytidine 5'-diphospho)-2-C-methyl-D-erythritol kinase [Burkholderiales bacterium]
MHTLYDVPAPAKINLFLHITGQRPDGYHLMQSVFVLLDWHDTLHFERLPTPDIHRVDLNSNTPAEVLPAEDLTVRAARLLQRATGCTQGARISLVKRLPSQAGLGGGSSDAASSLLALNRLWGTGLSRAALMTLGLQLGADVPFFLFGDNAWAEGVGEALQPIAVAQQPYLIVKPQAGLSTARIFTDPNLKRDTKPATIQGFAEHAASNQTLFGRNDLQPVAQAHCPDIGACAKWLNDIGLNARMTGSGSAVFAPSHGAVDLSTQPHGWLIHQCKSLSAHPLKNWAS